MANATEADDATDDCTTCDRLALRLAPGEKAHCGTCGRTLVREVNDEPPNPIRVQTGG